MVASIFFKKAVMKALSSPVVSGAVYHLLGLRALTSLYMISLDTEKCVAGKPSVLCLARLHFERDIAQLRDRAQDYNWIKLPEDKLGRVQMPWVPPVLRQQAFYKNSYPRDCFAISEKMGEIILDKLAKKYPVVAAVSANIDYWQPEGLRRACNKRFIPFLTLCREVQTIPMTYDKVIEHYNSIHYKYDGEAIAVFSNRTREAFVHSNFCNPERIEVTGPPRLDPWLENMNKPSKPLAERSIITMLSYFNPLYFAQENFFEAIGILGKVAAESADSGLTFKVKCKGKADCGNVLAAVAEKNIDVAKLALTYEADLLPIYNNSRVVIGYNSLAVIESLFSNAIVIVPHWGDADGDPDYQNINPHDPLAQKIFYFPKSAAEFEDLVRRAVGNNLPAKDVSVEDKLKYMNFYFHLVLGETASDRVRDFVRRSIRRMTALSAQ